MGCNKSIVRLGPEEPCRKNVRKNVLGLHLQNMWRRCGANKVGPSKLETLEQPGSFLYTENKPEFEAPSHGAVKTAWGEMNQAQAQILLELQSLGTVSLTTTDSGAISFSSVGDCNGTTGALPKRCRPPARLTRLDRVPSSPDFQTADKLEKKMKDAEERRKKRKEALKDIRAHFRQGEQHHEVAAEAERVLKHTTSVNVAAKQAAFQERVDRLREARLERARAKSRAGEYAQELAKETDELVRFRAAEKLAKKQERFGNRMQEQEALTMDRIRATSHVVERATEVVIEENGKEFQEKTAETTLTKTRDTAEASTERNERFRTQRILLDEHHRGYIRRALARRLAEEKEGARYDPDYDVETAQDSDDDEEDLFEPELKWLI
ncbi:uncharacterized protein LOC110987596 [Acanthaster planci]|uniref:Uncharacterized protein LOC110987596 n=1 Tax=Acanthaster planci TaxID=133434 RepID=A0A8B7ZRS7_ACAPL|nr:uncharacterized protein LOC110987596 [Acanthaster planci]